MKILVIEDKECHIEAAKEQLSGHDVTICTSYNEAEKLLAGGRHYYNEKAEFPFDVILSDLFLPPCPIGTVASSLNREWMEKEIIKDNLPKAIERFGSEIPYGLIFLLLAIRRCVPIVIVSDVGHHGHPICWALDLIFQMEVNGVVVEMLCDPIITKENGERVKDWGRALCESGVKI